MGVLPLQFAEGVTRQTLKLDGSETFTIHGVGDIRPRQDVEVTLTRADGKTERFATRCRIDTVNELEYFLHGGIPQYVLRKLAANRTARPLSLSPRARERSRHRQRKGGAHTTTTEG